MSLCRGMLYFGNKMERRSQDSGLAQTLNFQDSDIEDGDDENWSSDLLRTPTKTLKTNACLWDSGIGSPTPKSPGLSSPLKPVRNGLPIPFTSYDSEDGDDDFSTSPIIAPRTPITPPHKKFRSLKLYDTPHTPKSLLQKANRRITRLQASGKKSPVKSPVKSPIKDLYSVNKQNVVRITHAVTLDPDGPQANVNPFTTPPSPCVKPGTKRPRHERSPLYDSTEDEMEEDFPVSKKIALHEINTSRYNEEFYEVERLGDGQFGSVHKCIHRLDGCTYAIKKSKVPVAGSSYERAAMNEVYAHAVLGKHHHVVRYYSAWAEQDHMYIQNEFCNGGSLADLISANRKKGQQFTEQELKEVLFQGASGLKYIHSQGLVHLDIKPGNIFIHRNPKTMNNESGVEEDIEDEEDECDEPFTYKIGDLGHVTSVGHPLVEEGDCRYLPNEILQDNFDHLSKADIFSLALSVYEAGSGVDLPKNGKQWHRIRGGHLPPLPQVSEEFNTLLKRMVLPDPKERPSASALVQHTTLCPLGRMSKLALRRQLNQEKFKNEMLARELQEVRAKQAESRDTLAPLKPRASRRLVGKSIARSMSLQCF